MQARRKVDSQTASGWEPTFAQRQLSLTADFGPVGFDRLIAGVLNAYALRAAAQEAVEVTLTPGIESRVRRLVGQVTPGDSMLRSPGLSRPRSDFPLRIQHPQSIRDRVPVPDPFCNAGGCSNPELLALCRID